MLHNETALFEQAVLRTAEYFGYDPAIVEKDYYVTLFLNKIFEKENNIVFRGGTSLSKCYGLIDRFSEDIDLGVYSDGHPSEGVRKRIKSSIVSITDELRLELLNPDDIRSRRDFNRYEIAFPSSFGAGYLKQHLAVETAMFIKIFPVEHKIVSSLISDFFDKNGYDELNEKYNLNPFSLQVQSIQRTLVDKIFALCDYYMSGRLEEHSRHIYDIYKLTGVIELNDDFKELVSRVREVRSEHKVCLSAQPEVSVNDVLKSIIETKAYKHDYETRTEKLLFKSVHYETAIDGIEKIIAAGVFD